jgi:cephalosporin hydroxylase
MKSTLAVRTYNTLVGLWSRDSVYRTGWRELDEIKERSRRKTDISDHLVSLFVEALPLRPRLIVELGVRGGESTFVFERVAKVCGAKLVSVDIEDCSMVSSYDGWIFEKSDDIDFAKGFKSWCAQHLIESEIDILFIDTSHVFKHTVEEIEQWFPFLSSRSKVFFHDTNGRKVYFRKDGSIGTGFNNNRGVIAALEKLLERPLNENKCFVDWANGWIIRHFPYCAGLTVLERLPSYSGCEEEG